EEEFAQFAFAERSRCDVDARFGLAVTRHVLERGEDLALRKLATDADALKPLDRSDPELPDEERVFPEGFLDTAPARIARDVHDRREDQVDAARTDLARDESVYL